MRPRAGCGGPPAAPSDLSITHPPTPFRSRGTKAFTLNVAWSPWTQMTVPPSPRMCFFFSRSPLVFCFLSDFSWRKMRLSLAMRANCGLNIFVTGTLLFSLYYLLFFFSVAYCTAVILALHMHQLTIWQIFAAGPLIKGHWFQNWQWLSAPSVTTWEKVRHFGLYGNKMASRTEKMVTLSES